MQVVKLPKMDIPAPEQSKITLNLCFRMSLEVLLMAEEAPRPVLPDLRSERKEWMCFYTYLSLL